MFSSSKASRATTRYRFFFHHIVVTGPCINMLQYTRTVPELTRFYQHWSNFSPVVLVHYSMFTWYPCLSSLTTCICDLDHQNQGLSSGYLNLLCHIAFNSQCFWFFILYHSYQGSVWCKYLKKLSWKSTNWPLAGRFWGNLRQVIFKLILLIDDWGISCKIVLRWMSLYLADEKTQESTLVLVMALCHQASSHYLSQCWPRPLLPFGITRP